LACPAGCARIAQNSVELADSPQRMRRCCGNVVG